MVKTEGIFLDLENLKILSCVVRNLWVVQRFLKRKRKCNIFAESIAHIRACKRKIFLSLASSLEEKLSLFFKPQSESLISFLGSRIKKAA